MLLIIVSTPSGRFKADRLYLFVHVFIITCVFVYATVFVCVYGDATVFLLLCLCLSCLFWVSFGCNGVFLFAILFAFGFALRK